MAEVVAYLETHGVAGLSLRPLAAELGTSARMLVYYFGTLVAQAVAASRADGADRLAGVASIDGVRAAVSAQWQQMTTGREQGHATLVAQVISLAATDPDRYGALAAEALEAAIDPLVAALVRAGTPKAAARQRATILVSGLRGLLQDGAATGDRRRVNAAAKTLIDLVLT